MQALHDLLALSLRSLRHPESALAASVSTLAAELEASAVVVYLAMLDDGIEMLGAGGPAALAFGPSGKVDGGVAEMVQALSTRTVPHEVSPALLPPVWAGQAPVWSVATLLGDDRSCVLVVAAPSGVEECGLVRAAAPVALLAHVIVRERLLLALRQDAMYARQQRSLLRAGLQHDLKTPLAGILGSARTLLLHGAQIAQHDRRDLLEGIARQAERMSRMVDDTLMPVGGAREQRLNLRLLAERVAAAASLGHPGHVVVEASDDWVTTDPDRLERALLNLLDNALKYAPDDSSVHLVVARDGDHVCVTVADSGPGVSSDVLPRMFAPYATDPDRADGTGLGLSSAKRLVEEIGGCLSYSRYGEWTRFTVAIPDREKASAR